jgi:hypothetical protein
MKIILKGRKEIKEKLQKDFFRFGPESYKNLLLWDEFEFDRLSHNNNEIIMTIQNYLISVTFDPDLIFNPININIDNPYQIDDSERWLGSYHRMQSPGMITFYSKNLTHFFWYVILELINRNHSFNKEMVLDISERIINKTLYHELFHHYTDFNRIYTDHRSHYNLEMEEALAVAFSRIYLGLEHVSSSLSTAFFEIAYNYSGQGYRDWINYQSDNDFFEALVNYASYPNILRGKYSSNVYEICKQNLQSIVCNPNVELRIE